jgi:hypothetical protein
VIGDPASRTTTSIAVHINFQPGNISAPSGYLIDSGLAYASRGNGYTYGWNVNNSVNVRLRTSTTTTDLRYNTLIHTQHAGTPAASWQIALPNGKYSVHIVAGDPANYDSIYKINANNTLVVNGVPNSKNYWISGTATATVTNGILSVTNATGSSNNKICFLDITSIPPSPTGLKSTFMIGLENQPSSLPWMVNSGTPWDMRYQYLVGDVTLSSGDAWTYWNSPNGGFALYYAQASATDNYIPVFTYYTLFYSTPGNQKDEAHDGITNINTASTMRAYFANFKLLMDNLHTFGKPAIVHVEPDFWGYAQQAAVNNDPTTVPAKINSSGYGDVTTGLADNLVGFAQALVNLRNKYAPNVILAWHVSSWATGPDVGTNTDPTLDMNTVISKTVSFYKALYAKYDLLFFDPSDRDAGYYAPQDNAYWKHWWDLNNVTYPNFARFQAFVGGVTSGTNTKAMLWQVPIGNRLSRSENNTVGHWQDNRVEYFLGPNYLQHLQSWISSGLIGILFGAGTGGQSGNEDSQADGITNPPAINGNKLIATVSDDDGGYLRMQGANFYKNGVPSL